MQPLPGLIAAALAGAAGYAVRYGLVEPEKFGAACERAGPWWCVPRTAFIVFTEWNGFGWLSVALAAIGIAAMLRAGRATVGVHVLALGAMLTGGAGLILYNATFSSIAVVAAMLLLCRRPAAPDQAA